MSLKVVCIDDSNKPLDFPINFWVKKDMVYTVIKVQKMLNQGNIIAFVLEEFELPIECPYDSYLSSRFRLAEEDDLEAHNLLQEAYRILEHAEVGELLELSDERLN